MVNDNFLSYRTCNEQFSIFYLYHILILVGCLSWLHHGGSLYWRWLMDGRIACFKCAFKFLLIEINTHCTVLWSYNYNIIKLESIVNRNNQTGHNVSFISLLMVRSWANIYCKGPEKNKMMSLVETKHVLKLFDCKTLLNLTKYY